MAMQVPNPYAVGVQGERQVETGLVSAPLMQSTANDRAEELDHNQKKFAEAMRNYQDQVDKTRIMDMSNQLQDAVADITSGENGYEKLEGNNALERPDNRPLWDEVDERYKLASDEIIKKAGNARQRMAIMSISNQMRQGLRESVNSWVIRQNKVYTEAVHADSLNKAGVMALSDDEATSQSGFAAIRSLTKAKADREGIPPDYSATLGALHLDKASSIVTNLGAEAGRDYLRANKGEMTAAQIARLKDVIEIKKDSENITRLTENIMAKGLTEQEAMKLTENLGDKYKDKVQQLVKAEYNQIDQAKKERVKDLEDMVWRAYDQGEPIPADIQAEMRALDPKKYRDLFDGNGVFMELGKAPSVSDQQVSSELEDLYNNDIESFADLDLRPFSTRLTKDDMKRFTNLQSKAGDASYKEFQKELEFRIQAESLMASEAKKVRAAANKLFDEAKSQSSKGVVDEPRRMQLIKTLFTKKSGWWSKTKGYDAILDNPDVNTSQALFDAGIYGTGENRARAEMWLKDVGIANWESATKEQQRVASSIAAGAGWPEDIKKKALDQLEKIKQDRRAKGKVTPPDWEGRAFEILLRQNVFGQ